MQAAHSARADQIDLYWNIGSMGERSVYFQLFGHCVIETRTDEGGQVLEARFDYVGGVSARYTDGGASGSADEIITGCHSYVREADQGEACWQYEYNFRNYSPSLSRSGSGIGMLTIERLFPFL